MFRNTRYLRRAGRLYETGSKIIQHLKEEEIDRISECFMSVMNVIL